MPPNDPADRGAQACLVVGWIGGQVCRALVLRCQCFGHGSRPAGFKLGGDVGSERGLIEVQGARLFRREDQADHVRRQIAPAR